ncbi:MAG: helix-turn-helix domain-containing protein [Burkholderiales bacterium]|jgi:IclR family pca regulon transcriptional regulator|nr:helix-turn-helix domain-containing protein [Burkholderiales bacterium]
MTRIQAPNAPPSLDGPAADSPLLRRDWIAGLEKGLAILEAFGDATPRLTAAQMGERVGMTRTAARRHLLTLLHLGYVGSDGKLFWLTPRVLRLGQAFIESSRLAKLVQPFLQRITAGTQEIAYLSALDGDDVVYVARNGPNRAMNTGFVLGARTPAHVTAAGMLMLAWREPPGAPDWLARNTLRTYTSFTITNPEHMRAEFARIRQQDWALSEQQLELNYRGIAVPLRDARGQLVGALNVTMPIGQESSDAAVARVLGVLRETAAALRPLI